MKMISEQDHDNRQDSRSVWLADLGNDDRPVDRRGYYNEVTGHNVVEIPLQAKMKLSAVILLSLAVMLFVLWIVIPLLAAAFHWNSYVFGITMTASFLICFWGMAFVSIFDSKIERQRNLKVCKTLVRGHWVGYEKRRGRGIVYAPKYEIFINNRYEIRTVDMFKSREWKWEDDIHLLVNPDGCEAIPAAKEDFPKRSKEKWIVTVIIAVFVALLAGVFVVALLMQLLL